MSSRYPDRTPPAPHQSLSRVRSGGAVNGISSKPPAPSSGRSSVSLSDATPLPWNGHFDSCTTITANEYPFRVYTAGFPDPPCTPPHTVLVLLHGAGCSALTYASLTRHVREHIPVLAPDLRAHGTGAPEFSMGSALPIEELVSDVIEVLRSYFGSQRNGYPRIVLGGHSLGGSLAARVAASGEFEIAGVILIDVVEGTALSALPQMSAWLARRPVIFRSIPAAIRYAVSSGQVCRLASARISVPDIIREGKGGSWEWVTDLDSTRESWDSWFRGLSGIFLQGRSPKLLVLAGADRLDKELTIAQMQGRFQYIIVPESGHCIQEDQPERLAGVVLGFLQRNLIIEGEDDDIHGVFQQRAPIPSVP